MDFDTSQNSLNSSIGKTSSKIPQNSLRCTICFCEEHVRKGVNYTMQGGEPPLSLVGDLFL